MCNEPAELFTNWKRKLIEAVNRWWVKSSRMSVVVADKFNADRFERIYKIKPRIIPYGVDYKFWSGGERVEERKGTVLLHVGTISPYKNQMESVGALRELIGKIPSPVVLHLLGSISDGSYFDLVMGYAKTNGLQVEHHGHQPKEIIRDWYNQADILLHPVKGQGGWLVPFEAMCAGLPVVTTSSFSASDIILENRLGRVTARLAEAVRDIVENKEAYVGMAQGAKEWIKENMTWERFGEEMVNAYKENIGK